MRVDTSDASTCARSSGQGSAAAAGAGRASAVHNTQAKRSFVVRTSVIVGASCGPVGSVMQSAAAIVHAATTMWEILCFPATGQPRLVFGLVPDQREGDAGKLAGQCNQGLDAGQSTREVSLVE